MGEVIFIIPWCDLLALIKELTEVDARGKSGTPLCGKIV